MGRGAARVARHEQEERPSLIASGLAVLVASTMLVGYGNFLKSGPVLAQGASVDEGRVDVAWDKVIRISKTTPTLQVVVNPPLRRGTPVHDNAFQALSDLGGVRPLRPLDALPRLGVAELEPPKDGKTSWDFSLIDPMTIDFLEATAVTLMLNFSTIPQWMVKTDKPVPIPSNPNQAVWDYTQGSDFRDPTFKEVADYYARLLSWYTKGGFTDEPESATSLAIIQGSLLGGAERAGPRTETLARGVHRLYDAMVTAMRAVEPTTKFVGVSLAFPGQRPRSSSTS